MVPYAASLQSFLLRDLATLRLELEAYETDAQIWSLPDGLPNAAGTLLLHLAGNLQHYVGARLGGTGYVRDRPREFAARDVPRERLREELAAAEAAVRITLPRLTDEQLNADYPEVLNGRVLQTGEFLMSVAVHLAYHLGQVSYHRRLVTGDRRGVGAVPSGVLSTAREIASD